MNRIFVELEEPKQERIAVHFRYAQADVAAVKAIPGATFVPLDKGGPYWRLPLALTSGRRLREAFNGRIDWGRGVLAWGRDERNRERNLGEMVMAETAELRRLPSVAPELFAYCSGRPYQLADIAFMAEAPNPLNANAPGKGKTFETIGSIFESATDDGPQLILAQTTSFDTVWVEALERFQRHPVFVLSGELSKKKRAALLGEIKRLAGLGKTFWLITTAYSVRVREIKDDQGEGTGEFEPTIPEVHAIHWRNCVADEFHKIGLSNSKSMLRKGLAKMRIDRRVPLSGTPMGGKPTRLWAALNWAEPNKFTSKWRWAEEWLILATNEYATSGREIIEQIQPGREEDFYAAHARYMVRRTEHAVEKVRNDVWCRMTPAQAEMYKKFDDAAEVEIEEKKLTGNGILSVYTRLRQLAVARSTFRGDDLYPTEDSGKFAQAFRILGDHGITGDLETDEGSEQAIIFTQWERVAIVATELLRRAGIDAEMLSGRTKRQDRTELQRRYEAGKLRVLVMVTSAGGVSITLNNSRAILFLDETWNPDDQEQAEDRNRDRSATIYYLRTRGTIEEDVYNATLDKADTNSIALDLYRQRKARKEAV